MAIDKSSADCADEVIGSNWPSQNEDGYDHYVQQLLKDASRAQQAAQAKQQEQQYVMDECSSETLDALARAAGMDVSKHLQSAQDCANMAGWAKYAAEAIRTAKNAMNAAVDAHELMHDLPTVDDDDADGDLQEAKDADLRTHQETVQTAKSTLDSALAAANRAANADVVPTPFGGTPQIPEDGERTGDTDGDAGEGGADEADGGASHVGDSLNELWGIGDPDDDGGDDDYADDDGGAGANATPQVGAHGPTDFAPPGTYSPANADPGLTPAAPGMPGVPPTAAAPGAPNAPSPPRLPTTTPAAPAAAADAGGGMKPGAAPGLSGGLGSAMPAAPAAATDGGGGMKPAASPGLGAGGLGSGMPAGMGQPQMPMQAPQAPAGGGASPLGELTKPVTDALGKLGGGGGGPGGGPGGGGVPISEHQLDKLLAEQGNCDGGGNGPGGNGPDGDGDGKGPDGKHDHGGDKDPGKGVGLQGVHTQLTPPHLMDPYSPANTNPALNNPASPFAGAPSPASPVTTPAPSGVAAPMTELSADENVPPAAATAQQAGQVIQPATVEQQASHGHSGSQAVANSLAPTPPPPGGALAEYPTPGAMPPAAMGGMPMMPPMAGAGMGASGGGSVSPVLAAVPATVGSAIVAREVSTRETPPPASEAPLQRILSLPPEHAAAESILAGLVKAFRQRHWESQRVAVGVFAAGTPAEPTWRYIVATSDALSLIPLGMSLPAGVELLSQQPVRSTFAGDWNGNQHAGRKLAALANHYGSTAGQLVYLVSNDPDAVLFPGRSGNVAEVVQSSEETTALIGQRRAAPAISPRVEIARKLPIRDDEAGDVLTELGTLWGFHDATADDLETATAMLWAARWGRGRDRKNELPAITATYLYVEGLRAVQENRPRDAAFSASAMLGVRPDDWH
ncbi:MAG: hypothetical protein PHQ28_00995 [Mycobacterium sp.]|nr:hypothetical protein [Mycobacterium sp.]